MNKVARSHFGSYSTYEKIQTACISVQLTNKKMIKLPDWYFCKNIWNKFYPGLSLRAPTAIGFASIFCNFSTWKAHSWFQVGSARHLRLVDQKTRPMLI